MMSQPEMVTLSSPQRPHLLHLLLSGKAGWEIIYFTVGGCVISCLPSGGFWSELGMCVREGERACVKYTWLLGIRQAYRGGRKSVNAE